MVQAARRSSAAFLSKPTAASRRAGRSHGVPGRHRGGRSPRLPNVGFFALVAMGLAVCGLAPGWAPDSRGEESAGAGALAGARDRLQPGVSVSRELAPGEVHTYSLDLEADQYFRIVVEQRGIDVVVSLMGPCEVLLRQENGTTKQGAAEQLSWLTDEAGTYGLEIRPGSPEVSPGRYEVVLEELRPVRPEDRTRIIADQLFAKGVQRFAEWNKEALLEALEIFRTVLPLWQDVKDVAEEARTYNQIGRAFRALGETEEALAHYERALPLWREAGDLVGEASTVNNLGVLYKGLGDLHRAREAYERALLLWHELDEPAEEAKTLHNLGAVAYELGELEEAAASLKQALELRRKVGDLRGEASTLNTLALVHQDLAMVEEAFEEFLQVLRLSDETADERLQAAVHSNLGRLHRLRGEFRKAMEHYHRSLELHRALANPGEEAEVLRNLGTLYFELGRRDIALEYYHRALDLYRQAGNRLREAIVLRNLAWVHLIQGNYEVALKDYLAPAFKLSSELQDARTEAKILQAMGFAYISQGSLASALNALQRAVTLCQHIGDRRESAVALSLLGNTFQLLGDTSKARSTLQTALLASRQAFDSLVEVKVLLDMARIEQKQGYLREALGSLETALKLSEQHRIRIPTPELRMMFFTKKRELYEEYTGLLMALHRQFPEGGFAVRAFEASEGARARSLLDILHERNLDVTHGIEPAFLERQRNLAARRSLIQGRLLDLLSQESSDEEKLIRLERELKVADREEELLILEIRQKHPRYAEIHYPKPIDLRNLQALLDPETTLLEYLVGKDESFLFVVTREGFWSISLKASAREIQELVRIVRQGLGIRGRRMVGQLATAAHHLHELLVTPAMDQLEGNSHLVIVPDLALYYLPFEVFLMEPAAAGEDQLTWPYLVRRWSVSYAPSASVLASIRQRTQELRFDVRPIQFLAFADPAYRETGDPMSYVEKERSAAVVERAIPDLREIVGVPPLGASVREVQQIARLYSPDKVALYTGAEATEDNVKGNPLVAQAQRIHFATHGFVGEERPQYHGLLLARRPGSLEDGLLQVYEIFNLGLQADLVVLSACETGLGEEVTGEGLLGLSRAFIYAGASNLVVSLWSVADRSTANLMVRFYRYLERDDAAEALRRAKLELIEEGQYSEPYFWAPFILIGGD